MQLVWVLLEVTGKLPVAQLNVATPAAVGVDPGDCVDGVGAPFEVLDVGGDARGQW